jgi:hypothetical protein
MNTNDEKVGFDEVDILAEKPAPKKAEAPRPVANLVARVHPKNQKKVKAAAAAAAKPQKCK